MKSYLNAKIILFKENLNKKTTIITDKKIKQFSILNSIANKKNLKVIDISRNLEKIKSITQYSTNGYKIKNLAMAFQAVKLCGLKEKLIFKSLKKLKDVNGRLELVKKFKNNIKVFVDYAHTPDALFQTLKSLKQDFGNNISIVFGCGGERDKTKRIKMGEIASKFSDIIYLTDDNPRGENPRIIRNQIIKGIKKTKKLNEIPNRKMAIKNCINDLHSGEIAIIAGKGHEKIQEYKNKKFYFSDRQEILNFINNKNKKLFNDLRLKRIQEFS